MKIDEATLGYSFSGEKVLIVKYIFKNNSNTTTNFWCSVKAQAYQNGIECNFTLVDDLTTNITTDIKSGAVLEVYEAYILQDEYTPVVVEVCEWFEDYAKATKTFEIS